MKVQLQCQTQVKASPAAPQIIKTKKKLSNLARYACQGQCQHQCQSPVSFLVPWAPSQSLAGGCGDSCGDNFGQFSGLDLNLEVHGFHRTGNLFRMMWFFRILFFFGRLSLCFVSGHLLPASLRPRPSELKAS